MTNNILACRCSECGDTYNIGKMFEDKNMSGFERLDFVSNKQTCLRCKEQYLPFGSICNMDEFVFNAVRTVKM